MAATASSLSGALWAVLLVGATACAVVVVHDASRTPPTYSTSYDGTHPGACASPAQSVSIVSGGQARIFGSASELIGTVRMCRSLTCDTVWAQVLLTRLQRRGLRGGSWRSQSAGRPTVALRLTRWNSGAGRWATATSSGRRRASRQKPSFSAAMGAPADRSLEPDAASSLRTPARRLAMSSECLVAPASRFGPLRHLPSACVRRRAMLPSES